MKTTHPILIAFSIILLYSGCFKTSSDKEYTISGYLYQNCSRQPIANQPLILYQGGYSGGEVATSATDANGYFSVKYKPKGTQNVIIGQKLSVGYGDFASVFPYRDYSNAIFIKAPTCYLKVSMQVYNNSYTNRDTFYVVDYRKTTPPYTIAIPGPFTSQLLYTVSDFQISSYNANGTIQTFGYRINRNDYVYTDVTLMSCDTAKYIAEIK